MAKVIATVDDDIKDDAAALYESLGMSLSSAINTFLRQSVREQAMPFTPSLAPRRRVNWEYPLIRRPQVKDGAVLADKTEYDLAEDVYDEL